MNSLSKLFAPLLAFLALAASAFAGDELKVLCTTYPVYQISRNVAEGAKGVKLELLVPPSAGCPHDYSLTPQDMKRIAGAQILVVNGLKMEGFLGEPVKRANPKIAVVDSSSGIKETLAYTGDEIDNEPGAKKADDEHSGVNPHLFASPKMAARLALNIGAGLSKLDPANASVYDKNAKAFAERLLKLDEDFVKLGKTLKNSNVVTEHGVFDYLARDMGLSIVGVLREYEEESQAPSAAALIRVAKAVKARRAGAIFTEPQYPDEIGKAVAKEAKVPVAKLDPVASGPEDAPLDYYETVMRKNMEVMKSALGTK